MSPVDERIRDEVRRLDRPVDASGVVDRVAARKARRRTVVRTQRVALALVVLTGTLAGVFGLTRLIGLGEPSPAVTPDASVPPPAETADPIAGQTCDHSAIGADLNGDGLGDIVEVYTPMDPPDPDCSSDRVGLRYEARVRFAGASAQWEFLDPQPLPECETPFGCWVLATPDLNGDGDAEVAIQTVFGASTQWVSLYDVNPFAPEGGPALIRLEVAAPGDPWHEEYGFLPGPALFPRYGSVTHIHSLDCEEDAEGNALIVASTALYRSGQGDGTLHDVHVTRFAANPWPLITVVSSQGLGPVGPEGLQQFETGDEICGAGTIERGASPSEGSPPPEPSVPPGDTWTHGYLCSVTSVEADLDGDGSPDSVDVFAKVDASAPDCESAPDLGLVWGIRAQLSEAEIGAQPLPECAGSLDCQVVATEDLDSDGRDEVFVRVDANASTGWFTIYHLEGTALRRLSIKPPGDDWVDRGSGQSPAYGPGPVLFPVGGSGTHLDWINCGEGSVHLSAARAADPDGDRFNVHSIVLSVERDGLYVTHAEDRVLTASELADLVASDRSDVQDSPGCRELSGRS